MRIAILRRAPQVTFSMDVYTNELVNGLKTVRPDWEIVEYTPTPWWKGEEAVVSGAQVWALKKYYERFWNHPKNVAQVEADIFHIIDHTDGHIAYWLNKRNKPCVITCHDLVQFVYPEILLDQARFPKLSLAMWKYSVNGMEKANHSIAVSNNTKCDIVSHLNLASESVSVVPNAVNGAFRALSLDEQAQGKKRYGDSREIALLNVGSTHQRKNILMVLHVLKTLREKGLSVELWRTGGEFSSRQQDFIKVHNLSESIINLGLPTREGTSGNL